DAMVGAVQVQVTAGQQQSNSFSVQKTQFAPAFFTINAGGYVVAQHADFSLVDSSHPAVPGEVIQLYATGFGPTNPPLPTGQQVTAPSPLANAVQVTIGGVTGPAEFSGLVGPGLYQI